MFANWKNVWLFAYVMLCMHTNDVLAGLGDEEDVDGTLLGADINRLDSDVIRKYFELLNIIDINYNYYRKSNITKGMNVLFEELSIKTILITRKKSFLLTTERSELVTENLKKLPPNLKKEMKYHMMQAVQAKNLTELFTLYFIKYRAMIHAIQFINGAYKLEEVGSKNLKNSCQKAAYQLTAFAASGAFNMIDAIERILKQKYSYAAETFADMMFKFVRVIRYVVENIILKDDPTFYGSSGIFPENENYIDDMETLQSYFRVAVLGELNDSMIKNDLNVQGNINICNGAKDVLRSFKKTGSTKIPYDSDASAESKKIMKRSSVVGLLRKIDLNNVTKTFESVERITDAGELSIGYTDRYFILKPNPDEFTAILQFQPELYTTNHPD